MIGTNNINQNLKISTYFSFASSLNLKSCQIFFKDILGAFETAFCCSFILFVGLLKCDDFIILLGCSPASSQKFERLQVDEIYKLCPRICPLKPGERDHLITVISLDGIQRFSKNRDVEKPWYTITLIFFSSDESDTSDV